MYPETAPPETPPGGRPWLPVVELRLTTRWFAATLESPNLHAAAARHRPGWRPRLTRLDNGHACEFRHMVLFDWVFHAMVCWGRPLPRPAGLPGDDDPARAPVHTGRAPAALRRNLDLARAGNLVAADALEAAAPDLDHEGHCPAARTGFDAGACACVRGEVLAYLEETGRDA